MNMQINAVNETGEFLVFDGTESEWNWLNLELNPAVIFCEAEKIETTVPMLERHRQSLLALKDEGITTFGVQYNTGKPNSDYRLARISFEFEMEDQEIILTEAQTERLDAYLQYQKPDFVDVVAFDIGCWEHECVRYYARILNRNTLSLINKFTGELMNDIECVVL